MMNKAFNHLATATGDSLKDFKKIGSTALATTLVATSIFTGISTAVNATDVTITSTATISLANATNLIATANSKLEIQGSSNVIATLSISLGADGNTNVVLGDITNGTEQSTLAVVTSAGAITIAPIIQSLNAQIVGKILVNDDVAGAEGDLATFTGAIGAASINVIDALEIGVESTTGGNARFTGAVLATAIIVDGGDALEHSTANFAGAVTGVATLNETANEGTATVEFSGATRTIAASVTAGGAGEGTVHVTGTGLTLNGAIGATRIGTLDIDSTAAMTAVAAASVVNVATGKVFTIDDDFTGVATSLVGTGALTFAVDAGGATTSALIGVITGAADGNGTLTYSNTGQSTQTGNIGVGTGNGVGTIAVATNGLIDVVGQVDTQNLTVAAGGVIAFDRAVAHDAAVLTTTGKVEYLVNPNGAANQAVTGTIDGAAANGGVVLLNNGSTTTFASAIGETQAIKTLTMTTAGIFNSNVSALGVTSAQSKINHFKGDLTVGASKYVMSGAAAEAMFNGTGDQTVTGKVEGAGAHQGVIDNAKASGTLTFASADLGVELKEIELDASTTTVFKGITRSQLLDVAGTVTFETKNNVVDDFDFAATSKLFIDDESIVAGDTVFALGTAGGDATSLVDGMEIYMPSNLAKGTEIKLFTTVTDAATAILIAGDANTSLNDTAVIDYVASATSDDVHVTAVAKSGSVIASEQNITKNEGEALSQAFSASILGDTAAQTAFETAGNASGSTQSADLAKQLSPQLDSMGGSAVATTAMTGSVQGIVSNRMASLRSGDAYVAGMSAGNGMSANSGFIQAFGSDGEQKNTSSSGATVFGHDSTTSGVAIGFDGMTDNGSTIGLSASYSTTDVEGKGTGRSKNSIDSYTVSAYADKATENGYIEGSLTYGINDNTATRIVNTVGLDRSYSANYDSQQVSLKVGGGVPNEVTDNTFVTPFLSATVTNINTDAYTEKSNVADDALRLRTSQDDINSLVGTVGVKAHKVTDFGTPMISLAVNNEFGDSNINSNNTFQGGGTNFITSTEVEELSATLGLGYSFGNDVTSLNINYEANVNDDEYVNQYGSVKIVAKF